MKSTVAIYDSHWAALNAVEVLKNKSYPVNQLSVIGQAKIVDSDRQIRSKTLLNNKNVNIGIVLDATLAVLSQALIRPVPGLVYILGAGAIAEAIARFDTGLIGGIVSILAVTGIKNGTVAKYSKLLNEGKYLVIAQGNEEDVEIAKNILCNCGKHIELCIL